MNLLSAPFYALFSLDFYKRLFITPLSRGFIYLAYLAVIGSLCLFIFVQIKVMPVTEELLQWTKAEMPPIVWTPRGIDLNLTEKTYEMIHPQFGPIAKFDTTKAMIREDEIKGTYLFFTSERIYFLNPSSGVLQSRQLTAPLDQKYQGPSSVTIGPEFVEQTYKRMKPWVSLLVFLSFPFMYIGYLITASLSSLLGMILNQGRREKLLYSTVLTLSMFAITASVAYSLLQLFIPFLVPIPLLGSLFVTGIYLFIAIRKTEMPLPDSDGRA